jgi:hypothetical protein
MIKDFDHLNDDINILFCQSKTSHSIEIETSLQELIEVLGEPLIVGGIVSFDPSQIQNPNGKWAIPYYTSSIQRKNIRLLRQGQTAIVTVMIDPTGFKSEEDAVIFKLRSL